MVVTPIKLFFLIFSTGYCINADCCCCSVKGSKLNNTIPGKKGLKPIKVDFSKNMKEDLNGKKSDFLNKNLYDINKVAETLSKSKVGFRNTGCTCYLNSTMQALLICEKFIISFLNYYKKVDFTKLEDEITKMLDSFFYLIIKTYEKVSGSNDGSLDYETMKNIVKGFCPYLSNYMGDIFSMNDAQEFLMFFFSFFSNLEGGADILSCFCFDEHTHVECTNKHTFDSDVKGSSIILVGLDRFEDDKSVKFEEACNKFSDKVIYGAANGDFSAPYCSDCKRNYFMDYVNDKNYFNDLREAFSNCGCTNEIKNTKEYNEFISSDKDYVTIKGIPIKRCDICSLIYSTDCSSCQSNHEKVCVHMNMYTCGECRGLKFCRFCANEEECKKKGHKFFICDKCFKAYYTRHNSTRTFINDDNIYSFICLNRFKCVGNNGVKKGTKVVPAENMRIGDYSYKLKAIIVHSGDTGGGHYFMYKPIKSDDGYKWFKFNDSSVKPVDDIETVHNGYLFMYEKTS